VLTRIEGNLRISLGRELRCSGTNRSWALAERWMRSFGRRLCLDAPNTYPLRFPPERREDAAQGPPFIVGEEGGTVAGFNNDIALAPRLIAVNLLATL